MANENIRQALEAALRASIIDSNVKLTLVNPSRMSAMALKVFVDSGWITVNSGTAALFEASARFGWMLKHESVDFKIQTHADEFIQWLMGRVGPEVTEFAVLTDVIHEDDLYMGTIVTHVGTTEFEASVSKKKRTIMEFVGNEKLREFVQDYIRPV